MTSPERPSSDTKTNLPEVSLSMLQAFETQPHTFSKDFESLREENPAIAAALMQGMELDSPTIDLRAAFAKGALWLYSLLNDAGEVRRLEMLVGEMSFIDGDVDEDPQPSV